MKKRLQILYPGRHLLKICPEENTFFAELTIELTPYEIKCVITDDEPIARKGLRGYIEKQIS